MINFTFNITNSSQSFVNILSALLTPTIAVLGSYIAYQQWKTNEKTRKQSLYDYRYENIFQPILEICNKTINSIKDEKIDNIDELVQLHNTKLSNVEKYSFLLKENDFVKLFGNYCAIWEYVSHCHMHPVISQEDKSFMFLKLNKIYDIRRKYLNIEDEKYHTLWELIAIAVKKLYKFFALDRPINKIKNSLKHKKKKGCNVTK